jgi:hypothetical protein
MRSNVRIYNAGIAQIVQDELYLDSKEENEIWNLIQTDERMPDKQVKRYG